MDLLWTILMFALGIGLLVKGADWLVDASARIAKQFGVSNFVIGLTIVAMGTSLPELGAGFAGSYYGLSGLVLGNIIGSNIANLALVLGLAGLFVPIGLRRDIYKRDGLILMSSTAIFYLFCLDLELTAVEGAVLLLLFLMYLLPMFFTKRRYRKEFHFRRYLGDYADSSKRQRFERLPSFERHIRRLFVDEWKKMATASANFFEALKRAFIKEKAALVFFFKQIAILFVGAACIFFGANFVVNAAMNLPVSEVVTGLVFVAIGTSLPELSVTISSLKKGIPEIMIGNLIGSNISNILLVAGISSIVNPLAVPISLIRVDFVFMLLIGWLFLVFLRNDRKITRMESTTMLLLYAAFIATTLGVSLGV